MLKILLSTVIISSAFAVSVQVKKADVIASINTQEIVLKKGDTKELQEGTTLCYVKGTGKLVLPALKRQLKKEGRCLIIPLTEATASNYINDLKNRATVAIWNSKENVRHGAGTKGETEFENQGAFVLMLQQKELLIYGKEFGPLPVLVVLKDKTGKGIMSFENEESTTTLVRIGKDKLTTGMRIDIYNGFKELLLSKNIVIEDE